MKNKLVFAVALLLLYSSSLTFSEDSATVVERHLSRSKQSMLVKSGNVESRQVNLSAERKAALERVLGRSIEDNSFTFLVGDTQGKIDEYSLIVSEQGKHGAITFSITISPKGRIKNIVVLESSEIRGKKISRRRFLRQFIDKSAASPIKIGKDIQGVTGATISSKAAARAAKKALVLWEEFYSEKRVGD